MSRTPPAVLSLLALALISTSATAQRRITGRVTEQGTNAPLPAAIVTVVGTPIGALSNEQGLFILRAPEGPVTLLVRRIGYKRETVSLAAADSDATVTLQRDVLQLETEVITGAVTSVSRRNAANDVATISADQISAVQAPSIENALAGKIAGAQVIANSGAPGGGNQVRLRGVTSVFGSADPLYVVDGVIVSNETIQPGANALTGANRNTSNATNQDNGVNRIADLNPNDIETIEVLKGASASAIYGSKASNGVIIITTKQGRGSSAEGAGINIVQRLGTRQLSGKFGLRRFTIDEARTYGAGFGLSPADVDANFNKCGGFCDHEEELFGENPLSYETSISARGGVQGLNYFASFLNLNDGGIQKNTGYKKQALRLDRKSVV